MHPKMLASEAADILGVTVQAIHKQLKTKKFPHAKLQNRVYFEHDTALHMFADFKKPCKVFVFVLVKGGVGKSTLCREVAIRATLMGKKVLIIELDHQGNLTKSLNINAQDYPVLVDLLEDSSIQIEDSIAKVIPGLDIIPSRYDNSVLDNFIMLKAIPLQKVIKNKIDILKKKYDLILIDCPPSLGQAVASAVLCADEIILPTTPCDFSDSGVEITVREVRRMIADYDAKPIPMRIILNQYDNREKDSRETHTYLIKHEEYGGMMLSGYIRKCKEIEKYRRRKSTVFESTASTSGREDIHTLTLELFEMNDPTSRKKAAATYETEIDEIA
jgi:chromosome partitioning protein